MALSPDMLSQFKDTIARFARERLVPIEADIAEHDHIPDDVIDEMRSLGLFGLSIPEQYGGLGLSVVEECEVVVELTYAAPAFRSVIGTNVGIGSQAIIQDGTEQQKQEYLPRIASGELITSFCLTEPDSGSDAASLKTSARLDGDSYVLNGTKRYITNAPRAGLFTVMARSEAHEPGAAGISAFLIEAGTPGLQIGQPDKKMGQQGSHVADVIFEDCRVPAASIVGGVPGQGFKTAMKVLDRGRIHIAAVCVGVARRLIDECLRYSRDRKQFGQPIGEFQLVQAMLADSEAECYAAHAMTLDAARQFDGGNRVSKQASCCKMFASEMVGRVADRAVQIHGGAGYMTEYGIERFYRDVRLFRLYEGTTQIQQLIIARQMLREHS
ncbi:MAG: acyl-CoA dehydrogenase family protein [Pseudomonadota bacterium]